MKIRIGIAGYGNLGRGVELAVAACEDMELAGVFTRRNPAELQPQLAATAVHRWDALDPARDEIDVLILCGGSATDLPKHGPQLAAKYHIVDSFDTHAAIPDYFAAVDAAAAASGHVALISAGWDPGMFSLNRVLGEAIVPNGRTYTFWGRGLSQGHSEAVRAIEGVVQAAQYTIPAEEVLAQVRGGQQPDVNAFARHRREVFVVAAPDADQAAIAQAITTMPHYFADYDTTVHFISAAEFAEQHQAMPHGGTVIHSGVTGTTAQHAQVSEYTLRLGNNPEFTASVLVAYARAVHRLATAGARGAHTIFDIPPGMISPHDPAHLRQHYL